jgi:hypothetical protein
VVAGGISDRPEVNGKKIKLAIVLFSWRDKLWIQIKPETKGF